ncbi:hypothetical protein P3S67_008160 [Capsicum chacoense]
MCCNIWSNVDEICMQFACGKMLPWARTYLNSTAKALIVSAAAGMAYFVVADKTLLETARQNSINRPN